MFSLHWREEKTLQFTEATRPFPSGQCGHKEKWPAEKDLPLGTQAEHSNCGRSRRIEFLNDWRLLHSPHYQTTMKLLCGFCWLNHVNPIQYTIPYSSNVTAVCDTMREYEKQLAIPKTKWCMVLPRVHHFPWFNPILEASMGQKLGTHRPYAMYSTEKDQSICGPQKSPASNTSTERL